jgi:hypothetical protein
MWIVKRTTNAVLYFFPMAQQPLVGQGLVMGKKYNTALVVRLTIHI